MCGWPVRRVFADDEQVRFFACARRVFKFRQEGDKLSNPDCYKQILLLGLQGKPGGLTREYLYLAASSSPGKGRLNRRSHTAHSTCWSSLYSLVGIPACGSAGPFRDAADTEDRSTSKVYPGQYAVEDAQIAARPGLRFCTYPSSSGLRRMVLGKRGWIRSRVVEQTCI